MCCDNETDVTAEHTSFKHGVRVRRQKQQMEFPDGLFDPFAAGQQDSPHNSEEKANADSSSSAGNLPSKI
jgi:hypothetical protein